MPLIIYAGTFVAISLLGVAVVIVEQLAPIVKHLFGG